MSGPDDGLPPDQGATDEAALAVPGDAGTDDSRPRAKKAPNAFRTISEVADELHIPQHVLRFWETKFPQIKPLKRGGGRIEIVSGLEPGAIVGTRGAFLLKAELGKGEAEH